MIEIEIKSLEVLGKEGSKLFRFQPGLNLISGAYGTGKTSLLELIKFGLCGNAKLSEAVLDGLQSVRLVVRLGQETYTFERLIKPGSKPQTEVLRNQVSVASLSEQRTEGSEFASEFLLEATGMPVIYAPTAERPGANVKTSLISFWDIYRFAYVSQGDMGDSIVGHNTPVNGKRKKAFELMFGLFNSKLAELRVELNSRLGQVAQEQKRADDIRSFLEQGGIPPLGQLESDMGDIQDSRREAASKLSGLRNDLRSVSRDEASQPRTRLHVLERQRADILRSTGDLHKEVANRERLIARLNAELLESERAAAVEALLGPLDFTVCPRCTQTVEPQRVPDDHCYLCTQPVDRAVRTGEGDSSTEADNLRAILQETRELIDEDTATIQILLDETAKFDANIAVLQSQVEAATQEYVAPAFEQIVALSQSIATADSEYANLGQFASQWRQYDSIVAELDGTKQRIEELLELIAAETQRLDAARELVGEFSDTFDEILQSLGLVWYTRASVDPKTYMPKVGAGPYANLSGGERTVVSVAYHLALLTVGLANRHTIRLPSLLILDHPSKYLGGVESDAEQIGRNYRRIQALTDAYDQTIQVIVADNDLPSPGKNANVIELTYEDPLVPGMPHPGGDKVDSLFN